MKQQWEDNPGEDQDRAGEDQDMGFGVYGREDKDRFGGVDQDWGREENHKKNHDSKKKKLMRRSQWRK